MKTSNTEGCMEKYLQEVYLGLLVLVVTQTTNIQSLSSTRTNHMRLYED